jgi:uncharacterized protein YceK
MERVAFATAVALGVALLSGCGTVRNLSYAFHPDEEGDTRWDGWPYGGVAFDVGVSSVCIRSALAGETPFTDSREDDVLLTGLLAVDLPFSLAGDTLSLPVCVATALKQEFAGGQAGPSGAAGGTDDAVPGKK